MNEQEHATVWPSPQFFLHHWNQFLLGPIISPSHWLWALTSEVSSAEWPLKKIYILKTHQPITSLNWRELSTWLQMMTSPGFWNRFRFRNTWRKGGKKPSDLQRRDTGREYSKNTGRAGNMSLLGAAVGQHGYSRRSWGRGRMRLERSQGGYTPLWKPGFYSK